METFPKRQISHIYGVFNVYTSKSWKTEKNFFVKFNAGSGLCLGRPDCYAYILKVKFDFNWYNLVIWRIELVGILTMQCLQLLQWHSILHMTYNSKDFNSSYDQVIRKLNSLLLYTLHSLNSKEFNSSYDNVIPLCVCSQKIIRTPWYRFDK